MKKNSIEEMVKVFFQSQKIEQLENELEKMDIKKLTSAEKESWYYNHAVIPLWTGNRDVAYRRLCEAKELYPKSEKIRFSLGQEYEYRAEINEMFSCFRNTRFPNISSSEVIMEAIYCYSWGNLEMAFSLVEQFIPIFLEVKILDTNFLYIRGLPLFERIWHHLVAYAKLLNDFSKTDEILKTIMSNCRDFDKESIETEYKLIKKGDYKKIYQKVYKNGKLALYSEEYSNLKDAIYESNVIRNYDKAIERLEQVKANPLVKHSIYDLQLLAKCNLAHKFKKPIEAEYQDNFLDRVMVLFDPATCLDFTLLEYQEVIKPKYQERRKNMRYLREDV